MGEWKSERVEYCKNRNARVPKCRTVEVWKRLIVRYMRVLLLLLKV